MLAKSAAPATGGAVAQLPGPAAVGRVPVPSSAAGARLEPAPAAPYTETLAFGDRLTAAYLSIRDVLPYFGRVSFVSEHNFKGVKEALEHLGQSSCNQVLMPNPYGNNRRLAIYEALKELSYPVIVFDRGALPGSWFFDTGFNADSATYHPLNWDRELADDERQRVLAYVERFRSSDDMLEDQGPRLTAPKTLDLLGSQGKKILLVPLQRPSDTTITFFSNLKRGLPEFIALVESVSDLIEREGLPWQIVVKQHPLEATPITSKKFTVCPPDCHIQSLMEVADMVMLVNSGVGVNAMLWERPVLHVGRIFYGHQALNRPVRDASDVIYYLKNPLRVDSVTMQRFIFHLIDRVYSFGDSVTELKAEDGGALRRVTRHIDFHTIRLPDRKKVLFITPVLPIPIYRGSAQRTDMMIRTLQALGLDVTLCVLNQSFRDRRSDTAAAELAGHYALREVTVRKHPKFHSKSARTHRMHRLIRILEKISGASLRLTNEDNCPVNFRRAVAQACAGKHFDYVWVNYAKLLPAVPPRLRSRAVVDTNDIQTTLFEAEGLSRYPRLLRPLVRWLFWRSEIRLLRRAPTIVSINPRESEILQSACPKSRIVTLPAIVDADRARPDRGREAFDLLFVGSASHANIEGLSYFLDQVFTEVIERRPKTTMLVVGRVGTASAVTGHAVLQQHRDTLIRCETHVEDVASAYRRGRIVVAPILSGAGMKIKVIEAFAHGKCVVGTRLAFDGIRVEHERNAFIGDDARAMADAIRHLLGEPERRMWIEREARRLFERDHSMAVAVRTLRSELRP